MNPPVAAPPASDLRALFKLALPILVTLLAQLGVLATDALFAGRLGPVQLAAATMSAGIWSIGFIAVVGFGTQFTTEVARYDAASKSGDRHEAAIAAIGLACLAAAALIALTRLAVVPSVQANIPGPLGQATAGYLAILAIGAPGACLAAFGKSLHDGLRLPNFGLRAAVLSLGINAVLDWVLMFGVAGSPALGLEGCAWATTSTWWIVGLWWTAKTVRIGGNPFRIRHVPSAMKATLRWGGPVALSLFAESSYFHVLGLLIAASPVEIVSAHYMALNIAMLFFSLPLSLSIAASILGASLVATSRWAEFAGLIRRASLAAAAVAAMLALVLLVAPVFIASRYTDDAQVISNATPLLALVAAFQIADALLAQAQAAFRSMRATMFPTTVLAIAYWGLGLGVAAFLLHSRLWSPAVCVWAATVLAISMAASILLLRLRGMVKNELGGESVPTVTGTA